MYKFLGETNGKEKNSKLVDIFNSGLKDLKEEIKHMSKEEREIENPESVVKIVEMILHCNKQQQGKGLKILTPKQMLSRLPITLAQLRAGNNSEKLNNEIRQLLYSLYRSKNMTKQVYNNLIKYIMITYFTAVIIIIIIIHNKIMETIFMNTENSKTNESHRFKLDLADKINLENPKKNMTLVNLSIYYAWKNIKSEYNNNKFKISAPNWNETFDLPDGSYSIDDIQDYFEFIIKKHETLTENPSIQIYPNKIKNRIVFKIKTGYKLELLTPETMKLLGSTKKVVDKDKNGENVPKLESVEVVLVHFNLVKNDYQHASKVLFTFVPNKKFGQLLNISPHVFTMMNTINTEFLFC